MIILCMAALGAPARAAGTWQLAIHGGAGVIERGSLTPEKEAAYRASLNAALETGARVLRGGGSSLDAVEAVVRVLEDDPLFNAGKGAVFTAEGRNELDASIMDGRTRAAGAVAGVTRTKNPDQPGARGDGEIQARHAGRLTVPMRSRCNRAWNRWIRATSAPRSAGSSFCNGAIRKAR